MDESCTSNPEIRNIRLDPGGDVTRINIARATRWVSGGGQSNYRFRISGFEVQDSSNFKVFPGLDNESWDASVCFLPSRNQLRWLCTRTKESLVRNPELAVGERVSPHCLIDSFVRAEVPSDAAQWRNDRIRCERFIGVQREWTGQAVHTLKHLHSG